MAVSPTANVADVVHELVGEQGQLGRHGLSIRGGGGESWTLALRTPGKCKNQNPNLAATPSAREQRDDQPCLISLHVVSLVVPETCHVNDAGGRGGRKPAVPAARRCRTRRLGGPACRTSSPLWGGGIRGEVGPLLGLGGIRGKQGHCAAGLYSSWIIIEAIRAIVEPHRTFTAAIRSEVGPYSSDYKRPHIQVGL